MTVRLVTTIQRFIGLSTDSKPTSLAMGSTFFELDTKSLFIYDGSSWNLVESNAIDSATYATMTIDYAHHEIHSGSSFVAWHNASGGVGTKATITFTTPDTAKWTHLLTQGRSNVEAELKIGEGPTITGGTGSNFTIINRNRNSSNTSVLSDTSVSPAANRVTVGATVTSFGTLIYDEHFGDGKRAGGINRNNDEFVLKQNTTYAIEIISEAASSDVGLVLDWYEHTNKA